MYLFVDVKNYFTMKNKTGRTETNVSLARTPQTTTKLTQNMGSYDNPNTGSPTAPVA